MVLSVALTMGTFMFGLLLRASNARNSCRVRLVAPSLSPPTTGMMAKVLCSEAVVVVMEETCGAGRWRPPPQHPPR